VLYVTVGTKSEVLGPRQRPLTAAPSWQAVSRVPLIVLSWEMRMRLKGADWVLYLLSSCAVTGAAKAKTPAKNEVLILTV
jgi:hypothetical protein